MQLRVNDCQLQSSTDGGTTWTEVEGWSDYQSLCLPLVSMKVEDGCQLAFSVDGGTTWQGVANWSDYQANCFPKQVEVRFTDACGLETSADGGTTWAAVPGWADNIPACFSGWLTAAGGVIIPTTPLNPGNLDAATEACNIATWLAGGILKQAMTQATNSVAGSIAKLDFLAGLGALVPGVDLVLDLFAFAAVGMYNAIAGGTLGDYQTAEADSTLWANLTCAIYGAIKTDGHVTAGNYSAVIDAIGNVSYAHADVITALKNYASGLGLQGFRQLQQSGVSVDSDCSCGDGTWCYEWDFTSSDGGWAIANGDAVYTAAVGWQSVEESYHGWTTLQIILNFVATSTIDKLAVYFNANMETGSCDDRKVVSGVSPVAHNLMVTTDTCASSVQGDVVAEADVVSPTDNLEVVLISPYAADYLFTISKIRAHGTGTCPFGTPNCTWA